MQSVQEFIAQIVPFLQQLFAAANNKEIIRGFLESYGYHAVPIAMLCDPAGVPWAWIFLIIFAGEAKLDIPLMLIYGFVALMVFDHILYWIGILGGRKFVKFIGKKRPDWRPNIKATRRKVRERGALAVVFGRYLPYIGRWMGLGAGMAGMNYFSYSMYSAVGAALSAFGFGLAAHFVGRELAEWPYFNQTMFGIIIGTTLLGAFGLATGWWKKKKERERAAQMLSAKTANSNKVKA